MDRREALADGVRLASGSEGGTTDLEVRGLLLLLVRVWGLHGEGKVVLVARLMAGGGLLRVERLESRGSVRRGGHAG